MLITHDFNKDSEKTNTYLQMLFIGEYPSKTVVKSRDLTDIVIPDHAYELRFFDQKGSCGQENVKTYWIAEKFLTLAEIEQRLEQPFGAFNESIFDVIETLKNNPKATVIEMAQGAFEVVPPDVTVINRQKQFLLPATSMTVVKDLATSKENVTYKNDTFGCN